MMLGHTNFFFHFYDFLAKARYLKSVTFCNVVLADSDFPALPYV